MILDMVKQIVQETLKKFQDNKNREFKKAQEQIKETIEAVYKHQSETKNKINQLRMKIDNTKDEVTQDMENLRKQKCKTKWKANPAEQNKQKTESQNSKMKW
jgi:DNA repair photolyase